MNIVLLGKPGAGKGYISNYLQVNYGFTHISTGELCRKNVKENTEYAEIIEEYSQKGQLVPLNVILDMLKKELSIPAPVGYIFDGFPRNVEQAQELDKIASVDIVLFVDVSDEILLNRISKRRICPNCHKMFSTDETQNGKCLSCGTALITRADDDLSVAKNRLVIYETETKPLIDYYANKLIVLDNSGSSEKTFSALKEITEKLLDRTGENV